MRYFTLCLYSEGSTDRHFLERIVFRLLLEKLINECDDQCEIQEQFIRFGRKPPELSRADFILEQVEKLDREITIIFVHADGAGNSEAARANNCLTSTEVINEKYNALCGVPIVPVRETEAWALADAATIKIVTGGKTYALPRNPESIADPKIPLREIADLAHSLSTNALMAEIADVIPLTELRRLPSFRIFENDLNGQLNRLGVI